MQISRLHIAWIQLLPCWPYGNEFGRRRPRMEFTELIEVPGEPMRGISQSLFMHPNIDGVRECDAGASGRTP
jgi:hypothetical protein